MHAYTVHAQCIHIYIHVYTCVYNTELTRIVRATDVHLVAGLTGCSSDLIEGVGRGGLSKGCTIRG